MGVYGTLVENDERLHLSIGDQGSSTEKAGPKLKQTRSENIREKFRHRGDFVESCPCPWRVCESNGRDKCARVQGGELKMLRMSVTARHEIKSC